MAASCLVPGTGKHIPAIGSAQYAIRGYEVDALDFVLKPVNYYQFSTKLARALQRVQRRKGGQIALQTAGGVQLLNTEDIYWLERTDHTPVEVW